MRKAIAFLFRVEIIYKTDDPPNDPLQFHIGNWEPFQERGVERFIRTSSACDGQVRAKRRSGGKGYDQTCLLQPPSPAAITSYPAPCASAAQRAFDTIKQMGCVSANPQDHIGDAKQCLYLDLGFDQLYLAYTSLQKVS